MLMSFENRTEAGQQLAERLKDLAEADPIVLGLPRGGVPVAYEVAHRLHAPLDVVLVRKVGAPHNPEYGIGAVGEGGVRLLNDDAVARLGLSDDQLDSAVAREREEVKRRLESYRSGRPPVPVAGRTAIIVDDGLATGVSASAAVEVLRARKAARVVLAIPVGAPDSVDDLRQRADDVVCLHEPPSFMAVGTWYRDFSQTTDEDVIELLRRAHEELRVSEEVQIPAGRGTRGEARAGPAEVVLPGDLVVPATPLGLVLFAHGSGSSRKSPRNRHVARILNDAGFATLLFDLLTPVEGHLRQNVFDIQLLADRLTSAVRWTTGETELAGLPLGLFGASTGAAAALTAAADLGDQVAAVVSRGGRPDLATERLDEVTAPSLFIIGGRDTEVLQLNEQAAEQLTVDHEVTVVPEAGHLFEEPGKLDDVARHAAGWFTRYLPEKRQTEASTGSPPS